MAKRRKRNPFPAHLPKPSSRRVASGEAPKMPKKNPTLKRAKPSGWISATRVKFVKRGGRMTVLVQKAKPKAAKRRGRR